MNFDHRRTLLFLVCAVVLLGAGFAWAYANAYDQFYSPEATLDRELVQMDFDSRLLHYVNTGKRVECRHDLVTQLRQQTVFLKGILAAASPATRSYTQRKLQQAEAAINGQPTSGDEAAWNGTASP